MSEDGTLHISEVWQTDEGEYVCHATNPAGRRSSPPAILDVIGKLFCRIKSRLNL